MRTIIFLALIVALSALRAHGQPPLTITDNGYYLTVVDDSGEPHMVKLTTVIDLSDGETPLPPGPGPEPEPEPDEPYNKQLVLDVKAWASDIDDTDGAQALITAYSHLYGMVRAGKLKDDQALKLLKPAADAALAELDNGVDWEPFRDKLEAYVNEQIQRGTLNVAVMLNSVFLGLDQYVDGADAISQELATRIAIKLNEIIDECK